MIDEKMYKFLNTIDIPDDRDWVYEDCLEDIVEGDTKASWDRNIMKVYNQFDQASTYKACGSYSLWVIYNWNNIHEYAKHWIDFEQENPKNKWLSFQASRGYPNIGSSLQENMNFYRKMWWIDATARIDTLQGMKNALKNWAFIYTGSSKCSRPKASQQKRFVYDTNWAPHAFSIIADEPATREFIAINSFWVSRWDKWYFAIPYSDIEHLFTRYAIIDKDDTWLIKNLKYEQEFKEAVELWITNWLTPNEPATRKQVAVMVLRWTKLKN